MTAALFPSEYTSLGEKALSGQMLPKLNLKIELLAIKHFWGPFFQSLGEKGFHKNPGHVFCFAVVSHSGGSHERYSQIFGWGFQF